MTVLPFTEPSAGTEHAQAVVIRNCCTEGGKMTMVGLTPDQRALVADKLGDIGNLAAAGLVIAQFVSDRPFSLRVALSGVLVWLVVIVSAVAVKGRRK